MASGQRILVAVSNVPGESMLAWPALQCLIRSLPDAQIDLLAERSSAALALLVPGISSVIDETNERYHQGMRAFRKELKSSHYDAYLCLSPKMRHHWLGWRLGIRKRCVPVLNFRRFWDGEAIGRPAEPILLRHSYETVVNEFLVSVGVDPVLLNSPYFGDSSVICKHSSHPLIVVHPGAVNPSQNLDIDQYRQLLASLNLVSGENEYVLYAYANELAYCRHLSQQLELDGIHCRIDEFCQDWETAVKLFRDADLVIAEQGTILWMAGALDVPCVGFGPLPPGVESLRHPLANPNRSLMFAPPSGRLTQEDISLINVTDSAVRIRRWFHQL
ncbi:MAG: hypothetical protein CENE_01687 [Candidatus Celerinatantimonas neptuna]|nr:MAG: hypothetical protein CENE_01687 [Candidatus Celerinatantimonas neptuna]